jgi:hypothetical protein
MKKSLLILTATMLALSCNNESKPAPATADAPTADTAKTTAKAAAPAASTVTFPYTAFYSSNWSDEVSDEGVLNVLNSYKYWESGDMTSLRTTLADSIQFNGWNAFQYKGTNDGLVKIWSKSRDSMSSVKITVDAWRKMHSLNDKADWVSVWYTEVDKYKTGRTDSSSFEDDNLLVNGKIAMYDQHKQYLKKK